MEHIKIRDDLFLVSKEVELSKDQEKQLDKQLHVITVIDRSGSMSGYINSVVEDVKKFSLSLRENEKNSIGWFSGEGYCDFMLKAFEVSDSNKQILTTVLDQNKRILNTTCFSQILQKIETLIKDPAYKNDNFVLYFFTDGYPCVSDYNKEIKAIFDSLSKLKNQLYYSAFVGSGNYYNRELMTQMASAVGGSFLHLGDVNSSYETLTQFIETSRDSNGRIVVDIDKDSLFPFSISGKNIISYEAEKGKISFNPSKRNKNVLFYLTEKQPKGSKEIDSIGDLTKGSSSNKKEYLIKGLYAAAHTLSTRTKVDKAIDILGYLGDKYFIDSLNNSRTNDEYGKVENEIREALFSTSERLKEGQVKNYVPKDDVFCLLDLVDILINDEKAGFYPRHEGWVYNKISRSSEVDSKYPEFKADENQICYFNALAWNDKKLNLSVRAELSGTVTLREGYKKLGFSKEYPAKIYRNYSLVKDGFPNIPNLFVSISKDTEKKLLSIVPQGLLEKVKSKQLKKDIFKLNLTAIPVSNRKMSEGISSAKPIAELVYKETELEHKQSLYKYLLSQLEDKARKSDEELSKDQVKFLEEHGIKKGIYSPETKPVQPTDYYMATEFEISVKGLSKPTAKDIVKKIEEKKATTDRETIMASAYQDFKSKFEKEKSKKVKEVWLQEQLSETKKELYELRSKLQRSKFSVIMAKKWFSEFTSREDCVLKSKIGNKEVFVQFNLKQVKVEV